MIAPVCELVTEYRVRLPPGHRPDVASLIGDHGSPSSHITYRSLSCGYADREGKFAGQEVCMII